MRATDTEGDYEQCGRRLRVAWLDTAMLRRLLNPGKDTSKLANSSPAAPRHGKALLGGCNSLLENCGHKLGAVRGSGGEPGNKGWCISMIY